MAFSLFLNIPFLHLQENEYNSEELQEHSTQLLHKTEN